VSTPEELKALKQRHAARLWNNPAVCGIDIEDDAHGRPVFTVYLRSNDPHLRRDLPAQLDGHPVIYRFNPIEKQ
jgi:hypothetical protein